MSGCNRWNCELDIPSAKRIEVSISWRVSSSVFYIYHKKKVLRLADNCNPRQTGSPGGAG